MTSLHKRRIRIVLTIIVPILAICAAVYYLAFSPFVDATERLGDARLISKGAPDESEPDFDTLSAAEYESLDDFPVDESVALEGGPGSSFVVQSRGAIALSDASGDVIHARYTPGGPFERTATHESGSQALTRTNVMDEDAPLSLTIWDNGDPEDVDSEQLELRDYDVWPSDASLPVPRDLAFMPDGSLLLSRPDQAGIDRLSPDRSELTHWLGQPGDHADVELEEALGEISSLVVLPDNRVVFAADPPSRERQLYVFDGQRVDAIDAGPDLSVETPPSRGEMTRPIDHLALAPNGRIIAIGMIDDDLPRISLLDVDTGEVEVLIDLEGIEVSDSARISAVAVGDDLVFLADGKLWILDYAFSD